MNEAKIKEVFSDEAFVKKLWAMESAAEVQAALKGKGIDATEKEILELKDLIVKAAKEAGEGGELSLDALDEAAGGVSGPSLGIDPPGKLVLELIKNGTIPSAIPEANMRGPSGSGGAIIGPVITPTW